MTVQNPAWAAERTSRHCCEEEPIQMIETAVLRIDDDDGPDLRERLVHVAVAQSSAWLIVATATASFAIRICATSLIWRNAASIKPRMPGLRSGSRRGELRCESRS